MSFLVSCTSIAKAFGVQPLFRGISLTIHERERIGMIGPNGAGKSTLLKIFAGVETPDSGKLMLRKGVRVAYLPQSEHFERGETVEDVLMKNTSEQLSDEERHRNTGIVKNRVGLPSDNPLANSLSGGWKKRLAIASRLLHDPDLLLLDEPTNHLDLDGILWLEKFLAEAPFAVVIISHDRTFLENATTRIIEVNRRYPDGFLSVDGNYSQYLVRREELLRQMKQEEASLANNVRREIEWLRRGPKARTTKASARIQQAEAAISDLASMRSRSREIGTAGVDFSSTGRQTKQLLKLDGVSKSFGEKRVIDNLTLPILKGTKLGIVGPNGEGKSTVLRLLSGELQPDKGTVASAPALRIVTFDQQRASLNEAATLSSYLAPDSDSVIFRGNAVHIASYATRFLFRNDQLRTPISSLSGGEQARLLIAKLMLQPADVLLLDEPTNDLDIDTLQILEENLQSFEGAVVLITHDRLMIESVCNIFLAIESGQTEFYASYDQWQNDRASQEKKPELSKPGSASSSAKITPAEKKELSNMSRAIEKAEAEMKLHEQAVAGLTSQQTPEEISEACARFAAAKEKVESLYERWQELEQRAATAD